MSELHVSRVRRAGSLIAAWLLASGAAACGNERAPLDLVVSESTLRVLEGEQVSFTVALSRRPSRPIAVRLVPSVDLKLQTDPVELSFDKGNWDLAQTVTLTGSVDRDANNESLTLAVEADGLDPVSIEVSVIECPTLAAQDFWVMFNPNNQVAGRRELHVAGAAGTMVTIAGASPVAIPESGILVVDTGLTRVPVPNVVESGKAFSVSATAPVQVFANNFNNFTVDAFTAVPVQLLGKEYRSIGYSTSAQAQIGVYAIEDDTQVTIGTAAPIMLDRGQSFLRASSGDMTGTLIVSDKPVAVNSGDACINTGAGACDHVEEMLFPVASWASDFFIPTIPQDQVFRVVAATNGTEVRVDGVVVATLMAGQFYPGTGGGKRVQTSAPAQVYVVALGQANGDGDPAFILIPGVQNAVDKATFSALSADNTNSVVVSIPTAAVASLRLDGQAVTPTWVPYASGDYSQAQIPLTVGTHSLAADEPFIPVVWGEKSFESYGYVAGYGYPRASCTLP